MGKLFALRKSWSAAFGCLAWLAALTALPFGWAEALLLFATLVLLPISLDPLSRTESERRATGFARLSALTQFPAGVALVGSFALSSGIAAAVLACPWLLFTLLMASSGASQLLRRRRRSIADISINVGLIYLAVGGTWAVISRSGWRPLDFRDIIVLATAVHFHYAGLILPLLAGLAAAKLRDGQSQLAAAGAIIGVPLVATGITLSAFGITIVEWLAAWFLAVACSLVAVQQFRLSEQGRDWQPRLLFDISGASLLFAMILAAIYGLRSYWGIEWLDIPDMLPLHGAVNAFGFALPGLLAWRIAPTDLRDGSV